MRTLIKYNSSELYRTYCRAIGVAESKYKKGKYKDCVDLVSKISSFQYNLNLVYYSDRLMNLLKQISYSVVGNNKSYNCNTNTFVFYDSIALDNRGLTQQYLSALINLKCVKVVYIHENYFDEKSKIHDYLVYNGVPIFELGNKSVLEKVSILEQLIEEFHPSKAFFHLKPNTIIPYLAFFPYKEVVKYQINITDHAFWLGGSEFFNSIFEFREYGATISIKHRNFTPEQILMLPYYPWQQEQSFQGFDFSIEGKKILFAGGSLYKIQGDGTVFLDIVDEILRRVPDSIFVLAGSGNTMHIIDYFTKHNKNDRIHLIGDRDDINEVVKQIDVYLDTYPFGGGLMCQLAAINGKPLLVYKSHDAEDVVCTRNKAAFVFDNTNDLFSEAEALFNCSDYYSSRSEFFRSLISDSSLFNNKFSKLISSENKDVFNDFCLIDTEEFSKQYLNRLNEGALGRDMELLIMRISPYLLSVKMCFNLLIGIPVILLKIFKSLRCR